MLNTWEELEESIKNCEKCKLCKTRKNIVFGSGNREANIMFIGEGPGADEDEMGMPFVGKAGKLMDKAFEGVGIDREKVYIANIVKCRPPQNRVPEKDEASVCIDYLRNQVMLIKPKNYCFTWKHSSKKYFRRRIFNYKGKRKFYNKKRYNIYTNISSGSIIKR